MEITSWNKAAEALYGYTSEEAIGKRLTALTLPKDFQELLIKIEKIKESRKIEVFESERVGKDKSHMILEIVVSPVNDENGEIIGLSTIARDLTARRLAEKAKHDKDVLHRMIIAQEDERSRISRDLHDELGQLVTGLAFALERARNICNDDSVSECIAEIAVIAAAIDKSIDFLAWELRPALLEGVGIASAIENYIGQWSQHADVKIEFLASGLKGTRFAANVETNLYRIVQEALNNIHKHAGAERVEVMLERRDDFIILTIIDDGKGFRLRNKKTRSKGLGLTGMGERAALIGGTLDIDSSPGRGTKVQLRLPATQKRKRKALQTKSTTNYG